MYSFDFLPGRLAVLFTWPWSRLLLLSLSTYFCKSSTLGALICLLPCFVYTNDPERSRVIASALHSSSLPLACSLGSNLNSLAVLELYWSRELFESIVYLNCASSSYIVLMESIIQGPNLGRYDPLTITDQIAEVFRRGRTIHQNELSQIKIFCSLRADVNLSITPTSWSWLYKAFLPISIIHKKAIIKDIDPRHSPSSILSRLDSYLCLSCRLWA